MSAKATDATDATDATETVMVTMTQEEKNELLAWREAKREAAERKKFLFKADAANVAITEARDIYLRALASLPINIAKEAVAALEKDGRVFRKILRVTYK